VDLRWGERFIFGVGKRRRSAGDLRRGDRPARRATWELACGSARRTKRLTPDPRALDRARVVQGEGSLRPCFGSVAECSSRTVKVRRLEERESFREEGRHPDGAADGSLGPLAGDVRLPNHSTIGFRSFASSALVCPSAESIA
jgi:hypothetical protein